MNKQDIDEALLTTSWHDTIETVWGVIKRKVAEGNVNFNLTEVETTTRSEEATITPELIAKFHRHSMEK